MKRKWKKPIIRALALLPVALGHCKSGGHAEVEACLSGESTGNPAHVCDTGGGGAPNPFNADSW